MGTRFDMIGIFVNDLGRMVVFYRDVLGFEIAWDGKGPYAEFRHEGIRFSMYERAQLPGLLGQAPTYPSGLNCVKDGGIWITKETKAHEKARKMCSMTV